MIVSQETTRKLGFAIQYDEEKVGARLEALQSQLSIPTQYKGRISELLSQLRFMQNRSVITLFWNSIFLIHFTKLNTNLPSVMNA